MKTTSLDLRQRIVATYDECKWTQEEVAKRFRVSLGMVKKLLRQRRGRLGGLACWKRSATEDAVVRTPSLFPRDLTID